MNVSKTRPALRFSYLSGDQPFRINEGCTCLTNLESLERLGSGNDEEIFPLEEYPSQTEGRGGNSDSCGLRFRLSEFLDLVDNSQVELEGLPLVPRVG